nr:hypothetical protein [Tanacetum cinerariifolium]GFB87151.1 hypothetical protein [Tanacetum cinerariifolium]
HDKEIEEGEDEEEHVEDVAAGDAAQGDDIAAYREVPTVYVSRDFIKVMVIQYF